MPRKVCVNNLQTLCLENVVENFDSFWFKPFDKRRQRKTFFKRLFTRRSRPQCIPLFNPFEHLTGDLNRDLINILICKEKLMLKHFNLLLNNCLTELDLRESWPVADHDSVIDIIASRCQRLLRLNLDEFHHISPEKMINLVSHLKNLKYLSLEYTKCDDRVVHSIGSNCEELLELNLSNCRLITDTGMRSFIEIDSDGKITMFKKLILLKVFYTDFSSFVLSRIILLHPNLDIHCGRGCEIIYEAFKDKFIPGKEVPKNEQRSLKLLSNQEQSEILTRRQINIFTTFCPNVTKIVFLGGISDDCLPPLQHLVHLQKLDLTCGKKDKLTFKDGILPLLTIIGTRLLELTFNTIKNMCLDSVGACCLNLQRLKCSLLSITTECLPSKMESLVFSNLTHLEIEIVRLHIIFPQYTLKNILVNAKNIKSINLMYMPHLTIELLLEVLEKNTFNYLCELILRFCHNLTAEAVIMLLSLENNLSECTITNCNGISQSDVQNFENYIKLNMLNLKTCWG